MAIEKCKINMWYLSHGDVSFQFIAMSRGKNQFHSLYNYVTLKNPGPNVVGFSKLSNKASTRAYLLSVKFNKAVLRKVKK